MELLKHYGLLAIGAVGSGVAYLFGGWSELMTILILFMMIDYFTGMIVAGVFKKSPKSDTGTLSSQASYQGLCRKMMILVFVIVGSLADRATGLDVVKNGVIISFMASELLSITENAGLMGVPLPEILIKAIEILKNKEKENATV